jgi:hypothetical protein
MNEEAQRYQRTSEICLGRVERDVLVSNPTPTTDLGGIVRGDRTIEIGEDIRSILHTRDPVIIFGHTYSIAVLHHCNRWQ